ncbi:hypothetical protein GWL_18240 [Herbaspirillum sp. GW103]|uniref:tail fiber protein n=1 Tax=Herbaspirillum sp. GW103 TaxID=1175306 RepID=UPI00025E2EBE|nr:tail fiber protein [Herbaspirillum sp. GW103]EIJ47583.1 hypothetical protein GWL_18240 [Herbaspirillum sp. GW103]
MSRIVRSLIAAAISFKPVGALISTSVQAALAELDVRASLPGEVKYVAYNTAPPGWLKANGALVSRTAYAGLFAKIGTTYGVGDGSTTFALPDLRGEFLRGWDDGRGVDASRVNGSGQLDQFQGHAHTISMLGGTGSSYGFGGNTGNANVDNPGGASVNTPLTLGAYGAPRFGTETRPRNVAMLAVIKY